MADQENIAPGTGTPSTAWSVLDKWPDIAALVTGLTLLLGIAYNWSYFHVAAPQDLQLLSVTDHITSALGWLPASIFLNGIAFGVGWLLRVSRYVSGGRPANIFNFNRTQFLFISYSLFFTIFFVYIVGSVNGWGIIAMLAMFLWIICVIRISDQLRLMGQAFSFALFLPMGVAQAVGQGNFDGLKAFSSYDANVTVITRDGHHIDRAVLIRQLEKGVLLRLPYKSEILFVTWQQISELVTFGVRVDDRRWICEELHLFCTSSH